MKFTKEYLRDKDLLLHSTCQRLSDNPDRALFIGVYSKAKFPSLRDFVNLTMNISSITQDWYSTADLDNAYQYYFPQEVESAEDGDAWLLSSQKSSGNLLDWLRRVRVPVDTSTLPVDLDGSLFWRGDADEFGLIGETSTAYFEVFVADC